MCCGCPVDITRLMEDCYGLMGLKGTWTDLNWLLLLLLLLLLFCVCVCVCVSVCVCLEGRGVGGRGRVKLFHCIMRTGVYGILCV